MDLTIVAIPGFFGSMAYEARWLRRRAAIEVPPRSTTSATTPWPAWRRARDRWSCPC